MFHCVGGKLIRTKLRSRTTYGKVVGNDNGRGYKYVMINRKNYFVHRLIWMWYYGIDPGDNEVDHIDKDPSNNNIWNLQMLTYREHVNKDTKGYSYNTRWDKWFVTGTANGRNFISAYFDTEQQCKSYVCASRQSVTTPLDKPPDSPYYCIVPKGDPYEPI